MQTVNLSPYTAEQADIQRRQKLAELMQQQSMQPLEPPPTSGGWAVKTSPFSALAKMLQGYSGAKGQADALTRQKALAQRMRGEATQQLGSMPQGTPATPEGWTGTEGDESVFNAPQAATEPSRQQMQAWALKLAGEGNPISSPIGAKIAAEYLKPASQDTVLKEQGLDKRFAGVSGGTAATIAGADRRHATMTPAEQAAHDEKQGWGDPYSLGGAMVQRNRITGEVRQAVARPPQTHVYNPPAVTVTELQDTNDPNGTIKVDARTGKVLGKGPKLTDIGKLENKRQFNMQGIGAAIQTADDILNGKNGDPLPTQSGVGTGIDYAASLVGMTPQGAQQADQLRSIGGALTAKMPRMEGPQSDKDVALYREMAGRIGDSMLPVARRKAALDTVKELWTKYERLNPEAFADRRSGGMPPPGAVQRLP